MTSRRKVSLTGLAVLFVVGAVVLEWLDETPSPRTPDERTDTRGPIEDSESSEWTSPETTSKLDADAPSPDPAEKPAPASMTVLHGRVLDEHGMPIEGAVITLLAFAAEGDGSRRPIASGRTGSAGSFRLETRPGASAPSRLHATAPAHLSRTIELAPEQSRWIELTLEKGLSVRGRCVDEVGRPLAGVRVSTGRRRTRSNADGTFELDAIPPDRSELRFAACGRGEVTIRLRPFGSQPQDLGDVRLVAALEVRGTVVSVSGEPVAGARVSLGGKRSRHPAAQSWTTTGADGSFAFGDVAEGEQVVWLRQACKTWIFSPS